MSTTTARDHAPHSTSSSFGTDDNTNLARNWWVIALRGLVGVLFGLTALILPLATILALVLLFSAYMIVDGVLSIIAAARAARRHERWGLLTMHGVTSLVAGVLTFVWPGLTAVAFVLLIAAWAVVSGCLLLPMAFRIDNGHGRWWLALSGLAAIAFGILAIIAPLAGAVVLTWWIGVYALVFGALLIVVGFMLRSRAKDMQAAGELT
jgi:uncharacterized membrane protein HdeD (DUF308 family)